MKGTQTKRVSREGIKPKGAIDWDRPLEMNADGKFRNLLEMNPVIALNDCAELDLHLEDGSVIHLKQLHHEVSLTINKEPTTKVSINVSNFQNDYTGPPSHLKVLTMYAVSGDDYEVKVNPHSINTDEEESQDD